MPVQGLPGAYACVHMLCLRWSLQHGVRRSSLTTAGCSIGVAATCRCSTHIGCALIADCNCSATILECCICCLPV